MRIYEFAKEINVSTKEVLQVLQKHGFDVKSHMSIMSDPEKAVLMRAFGPQEKSGSVDHSSGKNDAKDTTPKIKEASVKQEIKNSSLGHTATHKEPVVVQATPKEIPVSAVRSIPLRQMTVSELAGAVGLQVSEIILLLL